MEPYYDAVIVGGGMVGLSLSLALGQAGYRILLIEKKTVLAKKNKEVLDDFDARTVALSYASVKILNALGLETLLQYGVPIQKVRVSVQGRLGGTTLVPQVNCDALGWVFSVSELEEMLYRYLFQFKNIEVLRAANVMDQTCRPSCWELSIAQPTKSRMVKCRLLVAADGATSSLREAQGINQIKKEYGHFGILANVQVKNAASMAIERFLPDGAIALIPWRKNMATCILTLSETKAKALLALDESNFRQICQDELGRRYATLIQFGQRICFPFTMQISKQQTASRFLLMGNAAHSIHPIAAQGLNLSLRDIWQLRNQILKQKSTHKDLGSEQVLRTYSHSRKQDQQKIIFATDKIACHMSGGSLPGVLKGWGVTLFDCMGFLKNQFTNVSMGLA